MNTTYEHLTTERRDDGVVVISIKERQPGQAANRSLHHDLGRIWRDIGEDPEIAVAVLTGEGATFMPSVDPDTQIADVASFSTVAGLMKEALAVVYGAVNCDKPIVSAINGPAGGAGLAAALLADVSVAGKTVTLTDAHVRFGIAAGDHAALIWPLLCGMAKAKYHLLTSTPVTGEEAERIGLVSLAVEDDNVLTTALDIASRMAASPQHALRWTKRVLNHWIRNAAPIFEASMAFEAIGFFDEDHVEAMKAIRDDRAPSYASQVTW